MDAMRVNRERGAERLSAGMRALGQHWPEYAVEAGGLGMFMIAACGFGTLFFHPGLPLAGPLKQAHLQGLLMGLAMGGTAISIIYSPWGRRSGAHLNPAVTLTFWRLGKIQGWDAVFYSVAQLVGGTLGVLLSWLVLGSRLSNPQVNFVATLPGPNLPLAFFTELAMGWGMMTLVLTFTNTPRLARFTGVFAGLLVTCYITFFTPVSGMSINPARSFASALPAKAWMPYWIYLLAPVLGMLLASTVFVRLRQQREVICAKLVHDRTSRCIFRCGYMKQGDDDAFHQCL